MEDDLGGHVNIEGNIGFYCETLKTPEAHLFAGLSKPKETSVAMGIKCLAKFDGSLHFAHFEPTTFEFGKEHTLDSHAVNGLVFSGLGSREGDAFEYGFFQNVGSMVEVVAG